MSDEVPPTDLLPLLFTTALVVYVLAMGSADLARSIIRVSALFCAAFCLAVWGAAALSYATWGQPVIEDFYATAILARKLGMIGAGWLLLLLALGPFVFALRAIRRLKIARLGDH
ncbi:MAG: hypothetical protein ACFCUT_19360 [Kiloniellaceae bacterium]